MMSISKFVPMLCLLFFGVGCSLQAAKDQALCYDFKQSNICLNKKMDSDISKIMKSRDIDPNLKQYTYIPSRKDCDIAMFVITEGEIIQSIMISRVNDTVGPLCFTQYKEALKQQYTVTPGSIDGVAVDIADLGNQEIIFDIRIISLQLKNAKPEARLSRLFRK